MFSFTLIMMLPFKSTFLPTCFFAYLVFLSSVINAQAPVFATTISKSYGGSLKEEFFGGSICLDGGYLLTGLSNSINGDINPFGTFDTSDIFVVKTDSQGNKQWALTFGGNEYDKARYGIQDSDSNFVVVGTTHSSDGDITFTHGNSELFVLKLDPTGNKIWMKQFGGTSFESGRYITQLADGNYLIAGYSASKNFDVPQNRGGHDGWLLKMTTNGNVIWSKTYGGSAADRIRHFVETPDGGYMFAGSSVSNNLQCTGNHGGTDFWIGKVDSVGTLEWSKLFGGSGEDYAYHIIQTSDGNFLATGYTTSNDGDITNSYGDSEGWLVKVDIFGNLLQQKAFGGTSTDRLYKCYETGQGTIITAGFTQSTNFDLSGINTGSSNEYWLMNLDANLNIEWGYTTGGTAADLGKELIYNPVDSSIVLMGDSNSGNGNVLGNHGDFDFWMVKLDIFTSLLQSPLPEPITMYYQSALQNLVIESQQDILSEIIVCDVLGKCLMRMNNVHLKSGTNNIPLQDLNKITTGIYTVIVSFNSYKQSLRIPNFRN